MPKMEKFNFCIGRPWPNSKDIAVYAYGTQVHFGTKEDAENLLEYVNQQTGEENSIYRLVKVDEDK